MCRALVQVMPKSTQIVHVGTPSYIQTCAFVSVSHPPSFIHLFGSETLSQGTLGGETIFYGDSSHLFRLAISGTNFHPEMGLNLSPLKLDLIFTY